MRYRHALREAALLCFTGLALACLKPPPGERCDEAGDENQNGLADCLDPACAAELRCRPEPDCSNLVDEDSDDLFDCLDPGCAASPSCAAGASPTGGPCAAPEDCQASGGDPFCFSENLFGYPAGACSEFCDLAADDCAAGALCVPVGVPGAGLCLDACEEDSDCPTPGHSCQALDLASKVCFPDCKDDSQCPETGRCADNGRCKPREACDDGEDNNADGLLDCQDPDCEGDPACSELGRCADGVDNDSDTKSDCEDEDCVLDASCAGEIAGECQAAAPLPAGGPTPGATAGDSLFAGSCVGAGAAETALVFTPPGAGELGTLTLVLAAATDEGLYVRAACDDPGSELGCVDLEAAGSSEILSLSVRAGAPVFLFVDGFEPVDLGPFTLTVEFLPDVCGDGALGASEECDDGGTAGGDGCDQACRVELAFFCAQATPAASPLAGTTAGLADRFAGSCTGEGAPEGLFTLTPGAAGQTGTLSLTLSAAADLGLYVRASCEDEASELGCGDARVGGEDELLSVAVQGGAPVAVFIDGFAPGEEGPFTLTAAFAPDACGDGQKTGLEECDDQNTQAGDGCDQACRVELDLSEDEPNDSAAQATPFAAPFAGEVSPAGDADFIAVTLGAAGGLTAEIADVGDGGCDARRLDSVVAILGPDGQALLAADDDGGPGLCSRARAAGLPAGTYFVRVSAFRAEDTFPYRLSLAIE